MIICYLYYTMFTVKCYHADIQKTKDYVLCSSMINLFFSIAILGNKIRLLKVKPTALYFIQINSSLGGSFFFMYSSCSLSYVCSLPCFMVSCSSVS